MKKYIFHQVPSQWAAAALTGCDDFFENARYPITSETSTPTFRALLRTVTWSATACTITGGYGQATPLGSYYFSTLSDDQAPVGFPNWNNTNIPASSGNYKTPFENLRHAMEIWKNVEVSTLADDEGTLYGHRPSAVRAYSVLELVKRYGDITWADEIVDPNLRNPLSAPCTSRDIVMDNVLADLDYAIANIKTTSAKHGS